MPSLSRASMAGMHALFPFGIFTSEWNHVLPGLLFSAALFTALIKLDAWLYKRMQISWPSALLVAVTIFALEELRRWLTHQVYGVPPVSVQILSSFIIQIPALSLLLKFKARTADGKIPALLHRAIFAAIAFATSTIVLILVTPLVRAMHRFF